MFLSLFCFALLCVHSSFAIILKRKRKLVALLLLSNRCIVTINGLLLFLTAQTVGLQLVIVVFPNHTRLLFVPHINVWKLRDSEKQAVFSESIANMTKTKTNAVTQTSTVDER